MHATPGTGDFNATHVPCLHEKMHICEVQKRASADFKETRSPSYHHLGLGKFDFLESARICVSGNFNVLFCWTVAVRNFGRCTHGTVLGQSIMRHCCIKAAIERARDFWAGGTSGGYIELTAGAAGAISVGSPSIDIPYGALFAD
jgi:hypothetical protein